MAYTHIFSAFTSHIETIITTGGYPFLFLAVILEGIPLIGTLVPGHVAIIAGGFLARVGILNIWWVLGLAITAAILGDFIGFSLGRKYGMSLIDRLKKYFFIKDSYIESVNALLSKHTAKSMIIGRFTPLTRALMPFIVGTSETPIHKFWIFNIIGAVGWIGSSVMLGYVFGIGYHAVSAYFGKAVLAAIIIAALIIWGYRFVNVRFHIFRRYELFALGLNLIALYTLARTIQDAWAASSFMANFDVWVNVYMATHVTSLMATVASWISMFADIGPMTGIGVVVAVGFALQKRWRSTAIMLLSLGSTAFLVGFMKELFLRARPDNALQLLTDHSFPSGHAAIAAAFFTIIGYLATVRIKNWKKREIIVVACVIGAILIGLSRIVLNVHWASDVIAGWALGVFLATGSILLVRYVSMFFMRRN
jgi:undecaprenyl-diphosphatase